MTLLTAESTDANHLEFDIVIVGTGPASLPIIDRLARRKISIGVIESGTERLEDETQQLNDIDNVGHAIRQEYINRLRMLGGTSNIWPGRCMPLDPIDFETRAWIPDSGWPISYCEYAEYLPESAEILGLPGRFVPGSNGNLDPSVAEWHGRLFAPGGFSHKTALWAKKPFRAWEYYRERFKRAENTTVLCSTTIIGLIFDQSGENLAHIVGSTLIGKKIRVTGKIFVFAMGGIENARMLLLAKQQNNHARFPDSSVGRYFMDHPRAVFGQIELQRNIDLRQYLSVPVAGGLVQAGLGLSDVLQNEKALLNSYVYFETGHSKLVENSYNSSVQVMKRILRKGYAGSRLKLNRLPSVQDLIYQLTPREILPHDLYRLYCQGRRFVKTHARKLVLVNHCEQIPNRNSRVSLSNRTDRFGNPLPKLDWRMDSREIETIVFLQNKIKKWVEDNKIGKMTTDANDLTEECFLDASHHIGTTRMGTNPETSVVDQNLKLHGIRNVYMAGSSVFPTGGSANPTWSIVALSLRLAYHLVRNRGFA